MGSPSKLFWCIYVGFCLVSASVVATPAKPRDDLGLTTVELIKKYGYPVETHETPTEDGYYVTFYRIKHGKGSSAPNRRPILLLHGMFTSADSFAVGASTNSSIPYILADNGYDVWLGNNRGTMHSRKHKTLNDGMPEFWEFSWHEIGYYDLAAMIDYVLQKTNSSTLAFIGHSQGTTSGLALLAERPEYNDKIRVGVYLAPTAFLGNFPLAKHQHFSRFNKMLQNILNLSYEVVPNLTNLVATMCDECNIFSSICTNFVELACAFCYNSNNKDIPQLAIKHCVHPVANMQVIHYLQGISSGRFRQYDYGTYQNMKKYGTITPPDYNLTKIVSPSLLFYSENDVFTSPEDVKYLHRQLPNATAYEIPDPHYNHFDYVLTKESVELLYVPLLQLLENFY